MNKKISISILIIILLFILIMKLNINKDDVDTHPSNISELNYAYNSIDNTYTIYDENNFMDVELRSEPELQVIIDNPDYDPQIYEMGQ